MKEIINPKDLSFEEIDDVQGSLNFLRTLQDVIIALKPMDSLVKGFDNPLRKSFD